MRQHLPLVSVLMTAYNREHFISEAIESVLKSTYENFELIIVDDGSSDQTADIAKNYEAKDSRIRVFVNEENLGDYPNRNKAASYAKGKYIKYLDSDDILYAHGLQVMIDAMEKFPDAGYGLSCKGDAKYPYPYALSPHDAYIEHFSGQSHFDRAPGSSIIKKEAFERVNGFTGQRMIGDNELWFSLGRYYSMVKFPIDLYWARTHDGQESNTDYAKQYNMLRKKVFEDALSNIDCPLSSSEKNEIINRMKFNSIKYKIKKLIS